MNRALVLSLVLVGCATTRPASVGPLRFVDAPPVRVVNDRTPIDPPAAREQGLVAYYLGEDFARPLDRVLTVGDHQPAANVNSLGEVPDSAWFTNRQPTPAEIRRGPGTGGPDRSAPWRVVGVKVGGAAIGIMIADARDDRYVLKFDDTGHPETETAADVIVQRLAWAAGYNVPDNEVVFFTRPDLVLDPAATFKDRTGHARPMTDADLVSYLGMVQHTGDRYRALASKLIAGTSIGGIDPEGTRPGDPNDRVPHERRRDLRGQRILWAWVNHPDIKTQNSLGSYTAEGYVRWYTLDFGESLGVGARTTGSIRLGYREAIAPRDFALSLVTFGLYVQPWERQRTYPSYTGLGFFDADSFDPAAWVTNHNWRPTDEADRFDELWATEILLHFTPAHIAAAVAAGQYSDARTATYLTATLVARQRKLAQATLSRVAPLVEVTAPRETSVCFADLWLRHRLGDARATTYRARTFDYAGQPLGTLPPTPAATDADGKTCLDALTLGASHRGYTILEIEIHRGRTVMPAMFVHLAHGQILGIDRR